MNSKLFSTTIHKKAISRDIHFFSDIQPFIKIFQVSLHEIYINRCLRPLPRISKVFSDSMMSFNEIADASPILIPVLISTSISTTGKVNFNAVFDTSLEYEYALIASALIKDTDENGNPKHKPTQVYKYLDSIRHMGNTQTFLRDSQNVVGDKKRSNKKANKN